MKTHFKKSSSPSKKSPAPKSPSTYIFDSVVLKKSLTRDARALGIPSGSAEVFIDLTIKAVTKSLKLKSNPTETDIHRAVIREMKKYSPDLTFYLQHRDQII